MKSKLGELGSFVAGNSFPQAEQGSVSGDYPFAKVSDLAVAAGRSWGGIQNWVTSEQVDRLRWGLIPPRSTVFAKIGEGLRRERLAFSSQEMAIDNNLMAFIPDLSRASSTWIYYRFRTLGISEHAAGSAMPYLRKSDLEKIELDVPPREVQEAIGEVLGALDDKIAANRDASNRAEELAVALASKCHQPVRLGEVAQQRRSSVSPVKLGTETVLHYSLPAFDEGKAALESAEEIKSAKNEIENPAVLVSKLNPRIPRLWPVDTAASNVRRLASTEFVVLESSELGVGELWAAILHGDVFGQLQSIVGGTSNSHQRVRPQDVLDAVVPDTRLLDQADRKLLVSLCRLRGQLVEANDSLARTRDELLPLLMSGRITVKAVSYTHLTLPTKRIV